MLPLYLCSPGHNFSFLLQPTLGYRNVPCYLQTVESPCTLSKYESFSWVYLQWQPIWVSNSCFSWEYKVPCLFNLLSAIYLSFCSSFSFAIGHSDSSFLRTSLSPSPSCLPPSCTHCLFVSFLISLIVSWDLFLKSKF